MTVAKGSWQKEIWAALVNGKAVVNPVSQLRGSAKSYMGRYQESFRSMLKRAEAAGFVIAKVPGIRGGDWSARYMIINRPA